MKIKEGEIFYVGKGEEKEKYFIKSIQGYTVIVGWNHSGGGDTDYDMCDVQELFESGDWMTLREERRKKLKRLKKYENRRFNRLYCQG
jgi:hypothetical protein